MQKKKTCNRVFLFEKNIKIGLIVELVGTLRSCWEHSLI